MKSIDLGDFVRQVKEELMAAQSNDENAFFVLDSVTLEAAFSVEVEADGKMKFVVFEAGAKSKGIQSHKVTLSLSPIGKAVVAEMTSSPPAFQMNIEKVQIPKYLGPASSSVDIIANTIPLVPGKK